MWARIKESLSMGLGIFWLVTWEQGWRAVYVFPLFLITTAYELVIEEPLTRTICFLRGHKLNGCPDFCWRCCRKVKRHG